MINRCKWAWTAFTALWLTAVDARIYALVRVTFAFVALLNLCDLWQQRYMLFSEHGMVDQQAWLDMMKASERPYFSVFLFVPNTKAAVDVVLVISALATLSLAVGFLTLPSAIIVFLWHISYTYRIFPALSGWDILLRVYAFLIMISPIGRVWSVDSLIRRRLGRFQSAPHEQADRSRAYCYGLTLMKFQLVAVYWQSVWLKVNDEHWRNGELVAYFLLSDYSRFPSAKFADMQILSEVLTFGTLAIEVAVPILLWFAKTRPLGFLLGIGLHVSLAIVSPLVIFSFAILVPYLAFLDDQDMRNIVTRWHRTRHGANPARG